MYQLRVRKYQNPKYFPASKGNNEENCAINLRLLYVFLDCWKMGTEKSINQSTTAHLPTPNYPQIDLPCEFGAKGMKVRMCAVTFHKSNNNTLDLSGTFHPEKK